MPDVNVDVIVLGAGMAGVGAALHLQARGRSVAIVERRGAGEETSFGNAGLIEAASIFPHGFTRDWRALLRYAGNRTPEMHYHLSALPGLAPWLFSYWRHSTPEALARAGHALAPLVTRALTEHEALIGKAGAEELVLRRGWMKLYRREETFAKARADAERLAPWRIPVTTLDRAAVAALEPAIDASRFVGGLHLPTPASIVDPGALVKTYASLFVKRGGRLVTGDARDFGEDSPGWRCEIEGGVARAPRAVIALGPWSADVTRRLGYRIPLGVKRGYHMHYGRAAEAPTPTIPVLDSDGGYVLAPMARGLRITTGAEFARRDARPTPVQLDRVEPSARQLFPGLGRRLDPEPWLGARPCLPDMLPMIGPAHRHEGLWFCFGHQHLGFTLGPVTGRLLAELMTGNAAFTDPAPYRADRFG